MNAVRGAVLFMLSLLALLAGARAHAALTTMVFIAPTNTAMPMGRFTDGQLSGGILKDLRMAISGHRHRLPFS